MPKKEIESTKSSDAIIAILGTFLGIGFIITLILLFPYYWPAVVYCAKTIFNTIVIQGILSIWGFGIFITFWFVVMEVVRTDDFFDAAVTILLWPIWFTRGCLRAFKEKWNDRV